MFRKNRRFSILYLFTLVAILFLTSCSPTKDDSENLLNPDKPISITLWHYYSGQIKSHFDSLVQEFNNTVGMEKGIVIDAQSHGDITQLETAIFNAANRSAGAERIPDIFAAYPENAYRINKLVEFVDFQDYFSDEEINSFRSEFIQSGKFVGKDELYILPIAKSSENLFLNKTYWDLFAEKTGADLSQLETWEGVVETAKKYYEFSDGKAFLGIDSLYNFIQIASEQLNNELITFNNGKIPIQMPKEIAKKIWDTYYIPFINGYFAREGRFASDDARIGVTIGYVGSTAGAVYFPTEITINNSTILPIENVTLPYPVFKNGKKVAVEQGAGMVLVKSNKQHEYAATQFLKWFTDKKQNTKFAVSTAYFPVKSEALNEQSISKAMADDQIESIPTVINSIQTTLEMFQSHELVSSKAFEGSFELRSLLNTHLPKLIEEDLAKLNNASEEERNELLQELRSEQHFTEWYESFIGELNNYFK